MISQPVWTFARPEKGHHCTNEFSSSHEIGAQPHEKCFVSSFNGLAVWWGYSCTSWDRGDKANSVIQLGVSEKKSRDLHGISRRQIDRIYGLILTSRLSLGTEHVCHCLCNLTLRITDGQTAGCHINERKNSECKRSLEISANAPLVRLIDSSTKFWFMKLTQTRAFLLLLGKNVDFSHCPGSWCVIGILRITIPFSPSFVFNLGKVKVSFRSVR